jgi:hypothetical protein
MFFLLYILPIFFLGRVNRLPFGRFVTFFEFNINIFIGNGARTVARVISDMFSRSYFHVIGNSRVA